MDTMSVNGKDFTVIKLLGKGKGGYSYLVSDGEHNYVLKQIHNEPCSYYTFGNKIQSELNDYKRLKNIVLETTLSAEEIESKEFEKTVQSIVDSYANLGIAEVSGYLRSEERRVGKECRSRWSAYH